MKNSIVTLIFLFSFSSVFAHYVWIETAQKGVLNEEHSIKIRFGEYTQGLVEKTNSTAFKNLKDFTLWVITPQGTKEVLDTFIKDDYYLAKYTPTQNGTYTIAFDTKEIKVLDYTMYDYTIFKPQYHAKSKFYVGDKLSVIKKTNTESIEIIDQTTTPFSLNSKVELKVLYKGKPLINNEISLFMKDSWLKKLKTDKFGIVSFNLPFQTKYTLETTFEEKVAGIFKGKEYQLIWHCATYCIDF
ncbi:DUF4198 domain-containing protein [Tenacibaculum piscium]|uniref:DUF4198 domain-containing protein n=1 Tax=Tenacibaculum piscium TaxID=1458515 RepID=UPI001F32C7BE|nr:DUF4198 domain-containing protein [Tenacibaculum piscium]